MPGTRLFCREASLGPVVGQRKKGGGGKKGRAFRCCPPEGGEGEESFWSQRGRPSFQPGKEEGNTHAQ